MMQSDNIGRPTVEELSHALEEWDKWGNVQTGLACNDKVIDDIVNASRAYLSLMRTTDKERLKALDYVDTDIRILTATPPEYNTEQHNEVIRIYETIRRALMLSAPKGNE
jgi:hypothetical protein